MKFCMVSLNPINNAKRMVQQFALKHTNCVHGVWINVDQNQINFLLSEFNKHSNNYLNIIFFTHANVSNKK